MAYAQSIEKMRNTIIYLYEFDIDDFELQDDVATIFEFKVHNPKKEKDS